MKRIKIISFFITILLLSVGCKIIKKPKENLEINNLIKANAYTFTDFNAKATLQVSFDENFFSSNGRIKIIADSLIKMSFYTQFGFPTFNLYANRKYLEINSIFFDNIRITYDSIQNFSGLKLNYFMLQNLLTDRIFTYPDTLELSNYQVIKQNDTTLIFRYVIKQNSSPLTKIRNELYFNTKTQKLFKVLIWDFSKFNSEIYVNYSDFKNINNFNLPTKLFIIYVNFDTLKVNIKYRKIDIK